MEKRNFNYGIGILRLLAMYMVVLLHVINQGGILKNLSGVDMYIGNFISIFSFCCVDLYAILSGYVGYREDNENYRYSKYLTIWVQVVTYSFGIALIYYFLKGNVTTVELLKTFMPVTTELYWYFTAYTGLFFIIPWLNRFVARLSEKEANQLVIVLMLVFSCYMSVAQLLWDSFHFVQGYSFVWLVILYVVGAWMKKNDIAEKLSGKTWFLIMMALLVFSWAWKMLVPMGYGNFLFMSYLSPTVIGNAVCLVAIFSKINVNSRFNNIIRKLGSAAFGIYIIHLQKNVWFDFIVDKFVWVSEFGTLLVPVMTIVASLGVYVVCMLIELIRMYLFRVLGIDKLIGKVQAFIDKITNRILSKV